MRIALVGSGGVGGYFGGRLAAAGEEVAFIARGAHLAALRDRGLTILSPEGDLRLPRVTASDNPSTIGPVDVVLFTVKLYDTESALPLLPALVGPSTLVVPLQNGVDAAGTLSRALPRGTVVGGTAYIAAAIAEPGVVRHTALGKMVFGALDDTDRPRLQEFADTCTRAGIKARVSQQMLSEIWIKFVQLTAFSGMTAVTRSPIGVVQRAPDLWRMMEAALTESAAVARAKGMDISDQALEEYITVAAGLPPAAKSSMLEDLERGKPLELPWLSGTVVRIGEALGVPTPTHRLIVSLLSPHVHGMGGQKSTGT
jgi:2-dehydropantoate 2-reductase